MSLRRSTLKVSAIVTTRGYPFAAQTIARPIPVLPDVASITVCPGFEFSRFLRGLDNAERETVLDRTKGIERFVFYEEIDAFRRQFVDADYRCMADRLENVGKFCHRVFLRTSLVGQPGFK